MPTATRLSLTTVLLLLLMAQSSDALAQTPSQKTLLELVKRADRITRGATSAAVFAIHIKTANYERTFKAVAWSDDRTKQKRALIKILGPALWRGYGTLKTGSKLKLYNPRNDHVTVVGSSMLGDAWMGSHLSNDDLVKTTELAKHYTAKLKKRWSSRELGKPAQRMEIQLFPRPTAPVAWGRIEYELWTRGPIAMPVAARYFRKRKDSEPRRVFAFGDVRPFGGRLVPAVLKATIARKPGEFTKITYSKIKFDVNVPKAKFSEQALKK